MTRTDLTREASWTAKFDGNEQHARTPFESGSPLEGESLTVLVVRERAAFSQQDRDHAQRRADRLGPLLQPALGRMMRHLGIDSLQAFKNRYAEPTILLTAGDWTNWSLAFDNRTDSSGIFCDWRDDEIVRVWVAD